MWTMSDGVIIIAVVTWGVVVKARKERWYSRISTFGVVVVAIKTSKKRRNMTTDIIALVKAREE